MTLRLGLGLQTTRGGTAFSPLNFEPAVLYDQRGYLQGSDATASGTGDPVGIAIDSAQGASFSGGNFFGLGDEVFNSPWVTGSVTDQGGGVYDFSWTGGAVASVVVPSVLAIGSMYLVRFTISNYVSGNLAVSLQAFENGGSYNANGTYAVLVVAGDLALDLFHRSGSAGEFTLSGVTVMELPGYHAQSTADAARPTLQANGTLNDDNVDDDLIVPITGTYSAYIAAGASLISDENVAMAEDYDVLRDDFIGAIIVSGTLTADQKTQLANYWGVTVA